MPPPSKPRSLLVDDEVVGPSDTLYVGGISPDTSDSDLIALFKPHGALDCSAMHGGPRSYAFVFFRTVNEARNALETLQGSQFRGVKLKIQFARPAKPYKHLWVGGISTSVTKEKLEDEFSKFGKIGQYNFFRERNTAQVHYYKNEDAIDAQKSLNGKLLGDEQIRVDFQRPPAYKREWPDHHDSRDGRLSGKRSMDLADSLMRQQAHGGHKGEGLPSNVLWVGYPPSVRIDEPMLHNAMILFGEIERIKCFQERNYAFVEFRSVDEARRAKEGLQGRLFNDSRIQIMYSSSELARNKDAAPLLPGYRGTPDLFLNEPPFGAPEFSSPGRTMALKTFSGVAPASGRSLPNMLMRQFESQGYDPHHAGPDVYDFGDIGISVHDAKHSHTIPSDWRRLSPVPGILSSPSGKQPPLRSTGWDRFDTRESKRPRVGSSPPIDDTLVHGRRMGSEGIGEPFDYSRYDRGVTGRSRHSPVFPIDEVRGRPSIDYVWRGIIAKGGTPVCHARCLPIGKGIESPFGDVVNCSARTGLDMLAKHYAEASGFEIVFFLPDSEDDFASYTEFLRYLGSKNRAGVAKLEDGTTLFLVPPSDFLTKVLNVTGPERLYGVVLNLDNLADSSHQLPQPIMPPPGTNYIDRQQVPIPRESSLGPQNEGHIYQARPLHEDATANFAGKPALVLPEKSQASQSSISAVTPKLDLPLTPELLASLASLIPNNTQLKGSISSAQLTKVSQPAAHDRTTVLHGLGQEHQVPLSSAAFQQFTPQLGHNQNSQATMLSQYPAYSNVPGGTEYSAQVAPVSTQFQDPSFNLVHTQSVSRTNYVTPAQTGSYPMQSNQQYHQDSTVGSYDNYRQVLDAANTYNPAIPLQLSTMAVSAPTQIGNQLQAQTAVPSDLPSQVHQLHSLLSASGQSSSIGDADKNQRYKSTLDFAANLLLQMHQQQQASNQGVNGSANHQ